MGASRSPLREKNATPSLVNGSGAARHSASEKQAVNLGVLAQLIPEGRLHRVLRALQSEPLGHIRDLALECRLSESHLQHLFKQRTGIRLGHLLNQQRLARAADLLANTDMSIKEVASAVGYEHTSSFTRAFLRRFETAPSQYRRQNAGAHD